MIQAKRQLAASPPAAHSRAKPLMVQRREDYQGSMGATTYAADVAGNVAAAKAGGTSEDILPTINIDLSYSAERQAFFRNKMVEHLNVGMHGYYGDLAKTYAYKSMKAQQDGYLGDVGPLSEASSAYNTFVPTANLAVKGITKHFALQDSLGFEDDADFENQLTGDQKDALKTAILEEPTLLSRTMSVTQKENELNKARGDLRGHLQGYSAIITGKAIAEVKGTVTENQAEQKKINDKIAKAVEIAGYVQKAAELAATGAGAMSKAAAGTLIKAPKNLEEGAGMAATGAGHLGTAVKIGMELYYAKELKDFESKITQAQGDLETLGAIKAKQELTSKLTLLEAAKEGYKNAVDAYENAIQDRRQHMAALAADADKKLVGEKGATGDKDFVGQVMLYMVSVRESRSLISNAQRAGDPATKAVQAAMTQLRHRSEPYQTNYESHGTIVRREPDGRDEKQLYEMNRNTRAWLGRAEVEKELLDKQEASAKKLMGSVGRGGNY